jgi:succinate-acetate transporter protein
VRPSTLRVSIQPIFNDEIANTVLDAAYWMSYSTFLVPALGVKDAYKGDERAFGFAMGIYLIAWCWITFLFLLAALRTNWTIIATLTTLTLAFLFLSISEFISPTNETSGMRMGKAGGAIAVVCSMCAFYAGSAGLFVPDTTYFKVRLGTIG